MAEQFQGFRPHESTGQNDTQREDHGWANRPHEDLVRAFRGLLWQERRGYGKVASNFPPAAIIREEINRMHPYPLFYDPSHTPRVNFFAQLKNAWDVIAFEHYPPAYHRRERPGELSADQMDARRELALTYIRAKERQEPRPDMIKLDPLQVKIIDALAEAADIPYQRGQAEIAIPERFRPYDNIRDFVEAEEAEVRAWQKRQRK